MRRLEGVTVELDALGRSQIYIIGLPTDPSPFLRAALCSGEVFEVQTPAGWQTVRVVKEDRQQVWGSAPVPFFELVSARPPARQQQKETRPAQPLQRQPEPTPSGLRFLRFLKSRSPLPNSQLDEIISSTEQRNGPWGLNLEGVTCPKCGRRMPKFRLSLALDELLWGGWTCKCGTRLDKWGKPRR